MGVGVKETRFFLSPPHAVSQSAPWKTQCSQSDARQWGPGVQGSEPGLEASTPPFPLFVWSLGQPRNSRLPKSRPDAQEAIVFWEVQTQIGSVKVALGRWEGSASAEARMSVSGSVTPQRWPGSQGSASLAHGAEAPGDLGPGVEACEQRGSAARDTEQDCHAPALP